MKSRCIVIISLLTVILFISLCTVIQIRPISTSVDISRINTEKKLILDAGHGGEDGGAVSPMGIPESQINLSIVQKMNDILCFCGNVPILLRAEDISLHDSNAATLREKKVSDLKNRVLTVNEIQNGVLISIHQNTYPDEKYRGGQTFYANTGGSQNLAYHIQTALKHTLQHSNERESKRIPDTVYLMNHVTCPAVLVECGFLTNKADERLLMDTIYQKKLAMTLSSAWLTFKW